MKILFITIGFAPYSFSESLCNSKLVLAMQKEGWEVDVISRIDRGTNYSEIWTEPWMQLKDTTYYAEYPFGNKVTRIFDVMKSVLKMNYFFIEGIRWAAHTYDLALSLCKQKRYDVIITRSPSDIPHIIGVKLSKKMGIKWISNWNDPATTLWPKPYTQKLTNREYTVARKYESTCLLNSDAITFPAETLASIFKKEYPFLSNKICVIIPHIALINTLLRERKHTKDGVFRICHSGNLSIERNPELLFKAIREIIDEQAIQMRLDIMGYANDFTQSLVSKYRLNDIVNFIGGYPYIEAMNLLPCYDVLVLIEAILDYGVFFPSKLVDYAQSKRPILAISPSKGYVAERIKKKGGGIVVDNANYKEIKIALWNMYQKWETNILQDSYSTDCLLKDYSTGKVIELYRSLFKQLGILN